MRVRTPRPAGNPTSRRRFTAPTLATLILAAACDPAPSARQTLTFPTDVGTTSGQSLGAPSSDPHARIGLYNWNADSTQYGFSDTLFDLSESLIHGLRARTLRVALSTSDAYSGATFATLADAAASTPFNKLFNSCDFDTYLLTTYSANDGISVWVPDLLQNAEGTTVYEGSSAAAAETAELTALATQLGKVSTTCPNPKRFIVLNWEGDSAMNDLVGAPLPLTWDGTTNRLSQQAWDNFTAWINARAAGIRAAGVANVFSGLEFAAVERKAANDLDYKDCAPGDTGLDPSCAPCDSDLHKCVSSYVATRVNVDYLSYSSWQSLGIHVSDADIGTRLQNDLAYVRSLTGKPPSAMLVGEFGIDRAQLPDPQGSRMSNLLAGIIASGASYATMWQVLDNPVSATDGYKFGAWSSAQVNGLTSAGAALKAFYDSEPAPTIACVQDLTTYLCGNAQPGGYVTLWGTGFGSTESLTLGGHALNVIYISPDGVQLNAQLPNDVPVGPNQPLVISNGHSASTSVQVGATCVLAAPTTIPHGGHWPVQISSTPAGLSVFYFGTHNGAQDATSVYAGGVTPLTANYGPYPNPSGDQYTRYAVLRDSSGHDVCTTNTVTVTVQ